MLDTLFDSALASVSVVLLAHMCVGISVWWVSLPLAVIVIISTMWWVCKW
jgi:hypothetical protein